MRHCTYINFYILYSQGFIHSAKRNRLTVDRTAKLTYIAHNHKLFSESSKPQNFHEDENYETEIADDRDSFDFEIENVTKDNGNSQPYVIDSDSDNEF